MKLKISVSAAKKQKVELHLKALQSALTAFAQISSVGNKLTNEHAKLLEKVTRLEASVSTDDAAAMQELSNAREALRLTESRIQSVTATDAAARPQGVALGELLAITRDQITYPALESSYLKLVDDAEDLFRPYFRKGGHARGFAERSDLIAQLGLHIGRSFGREPNVVEARKAITLCQQILSGELQFDFETD